MGQLVDLLGRTISREMIRKELEVSRRLADRAQDELTEMKWLERGYRLRRALRWLDDPKAGTKTWKDLVAGRRVPWPNSAHWPISCANCCSIPSPPPARPP